MARIRRGKCAFWANQPHVRPSPPVTHGHLCDQWDSAVARRAERRIRCGHRAEVVERHTRMTQTHLPERACGFESRPRHTACRSVGGQWQRRPVRSRHPATVRADARRQPGEAPGLRRGQGLLRPLDLPAAAARARQQARAADPPRALAARDRRGAPRSPAAGLFHSDGWRGHDVQVHRKDGCVTRYRCPRYEPTNLSGDIRRLCADALDQLGIAWRPNGRLRVSVDRRAVVAALDVHVGPKS